MTSEAQRTNKAITPDILPTGTICVSFEIPDDLLVRAAVHGVVHDLTKARHWQPQGDGDTMPIELAELFRQLIFDTYQETDCMIDCEQVQGCLDDQDPPPRRTPDKQWLQDLLENAGLIDCGSADKDIIYGFTTQLVDFFDTVVTDIFELIEAATNSLEIIAEVLDDIPVFGSIPAIAADFGAFIQATFAELYAEGVTIELKTQIACDLFCIAVQHECTLTQNDIAIYFSDQLQVNVIGADINDYISWFLGLNSSVPDKVIVLAAFALIAHSLAWGESIRGVGNASRLNALVNAMYNDPDSDWMILCDQCEQFWCYEWDFQDGMYHSWTRRINAGIPDGGIFAGLGVRSARQPANGRHSIWLESHTGELIGINELEIQYTSPYALTALEYKKDSIVTTRTFTGWPAGASIVKTINSAFLAGWDDAQLYLYGPPTSSTNYFYIEKIRVRGFGTLPAGLSGGEEC